MQQTGKPAPKTKVALSWLFLLGNLILWLVLAAWWFRRRTPGPEAPPDFTRSVLAFGFGGVFLAAGIAGYAIVLFTNCLTFNLNRPVWNELRVKFFLVNIVVPLLISLGLGFMLSAFLSPVLARMGLGGGLAYFLPVLGMVALVQISQMWVQVWKPLTERVVTRRLLALGLTPAQLQNAVLIGTSNPERSSFKKFGSVLDDVGALWIGPDQLVYWGDGEQFAINREQLERIERKADAGSASILGGIAHVILHVRLPDGAVRQIRLHTINHWTMGRHCKAMDHLAELILAWHTRAAGA